MKTECLFNGEDILVSEGLFANNVINREWLRPDACHEHVKYVELVLRNLWWRPAFAIFDGHNLNSEVLPEVHFEAKLPISPMGYDLNNKAHRHVTGIVNILPTPF
jgi:hypothetical protein